MMMDGSPGRHPPEQHIALDRAAALVLAAATAEDLDAPSMLLSHEINELANTVTREELCRVLGETAMLVSQLGQMFVNAAREDKDVVFTPEQNIARTRLAVRALVGATHDYYNGVDPTIRDPGFYDEPGA